MYDADEEWEAAFARFCSAVDTTGVRALIVGAWQEAYDTDASSVIEALLAARDRLPALRSLFLGDIVISVPYAEREARRRGEPGAREIERLLVHGLLHLGGYDHETDDGEMDALEARVRSRLGLADRDRDRDGDGAPRRSAR